VGLGVRVHINDEEWYPVFDIFEAANGRYELDPELVARYQEAKVTHSAVMKEVVGVIDAQIAAELAASST